MKKYVGFLGVVGWLYSGAYAFAEPFPRFECVSSKDKNRGFLCERVEGIPIETKVLTRKQREEFSSLLLPKTNIDEWRYEDVDEAELKRERQEAEDRRIAQEDEAEAERIRQADELRQQEDERARLIAEEEAQNAEGDDETDGSSKKPIPKTRQRKEEKKKPPVAAPRSQPKPTLETIEEDFDAEEALAREAAEVDRKAEEERQLAKQRAEADRQREEELRQLEAQEREAEAARQRFQRELARAQEELAALEADRLAREAAEAEERERVRQEERERRVAEEGRRLEEAERQRQMDKEERDRRRQEEIDQLAKDLTAEIDQATKFAKEEAERLKSSVVDEVVEEIADNPPEQTVYSEVQEHPLEFAKSTQPQVGPKPTRVFKLTPDKNIQKQLIRNPETDPSNHRSFFRRVQWQHPKSALEQGLGKEHIQIFDFSFQDAFPEEQKEKLAKFLASSQFGLWKPPEHMRTVYRASGRLMQKIPGLNTQDSDFLKASFQITGETAGIATYQVRNTKAEKQNSKIVQKNREIAEKNKIEIAQEQTESEVENDSTIGEYNEKVARYNREAKAQGKKNKKMMSEETTEHKVKIFWENKDGKPVNPRIECGGLSNQKGVFRTDVEAEESDLEADSSSESEDSEEEEITQPSVSAPPKELAEVEALLAEAEAYNAKEAAQTAQKPTSSKQKPRVNVVKEASAQIPQETVIRLDSARKSDQKAVNGLKLVDGSEPNAEKYVRAYNSENRQIYYVHGAADNKTEKEGKLTPKILDIIMANELALAKKFGIESIKSVEVRIESGAVKKAEVDFIGKKGTANGGNAGGAQKISAKLFWAKGKPELSYSPPETGIFVKLENDLESTYQKKIKGTAAENPSSTVPVTPAAPSTSTDEEKPEIVDENVETTDADQEESEELATPQGNSASKKPVIKPRSILKKESSEEPDQQPTKEPVVEKNPKKKVHFADEKKPEIVDKDVETTDVDQEESEELATPQGENSQDSSEKKPVAAKRKVFSDTAFKKPPVGGVKVMFSSGPDSTQKIDILEPMTEESEKPPTSTKPQPAPRNMSAAQTGSSEGARVPKPRMSLKPQVLNEHLDDAEHTLREAMKELETPSVPLQAPEEPLKHAEDRNSLDISELDEVIEVLAPITTDPVASEQPSVDDASQDSSSESGDEGGKSDSDEEMAGKTCEVEAELPPEAFSNVSEGSETQNEVVVVNGAATTDLSGSAQKNSSDTAPGNGETSPTRGESESAQAAQAGDAAVDPESNLSSVPDQVDSSIPDSSSSGGTATDSTTETTATPTSDTGGDGGGNNTGDGGTGGAGDGAGGGDNNSPTETQPAPTAEVV